MKIALLQTDIVWATPSANIRRAEDMMVQAPGADLYVLPEMWATGFATRPEGIAEEEATSAALAWMKRTALQHNCAISGSLAVRIEDGSYRNRHFFVTPEDVVFYDKRHLFTHGHEDKHYTAGNEAIIVSWQGWRLLLQTCYDLRFPVFSRYGRAGEYDAIVYVANWPEKRQLAWQTLIRARAIENQCYVLAVNRTGDDKICHYAGGSAVIDPIGRLVAECSSAERPVVTEISIDKLKEMRSHFRVLEDRDNL
ncbi:MAG: nitrilase family protein [Prevotella sp.]|nr:nitrilase family protein [Prevotella sp.]